MDGNIIVGIAAIAVVPIGAFVRKVYVTAEELAVHTASDAVLFESLKGQLSDLKEGQKDQTNKLDRLVEKLL